MILDEICAHKRVEVEERKQKRPLEELNETISMVEKPRDFRAALRLEGISLIAEIKRHSPVKGTFLTDVDPVDLGGLYEQSGARCISVLTDERYFKGTLEDLTAVRQNVRVPCLRKDFIVDEYQIYEARAAQADAILLIMRVLSDAEVQRFQELAADLGMASLVETHNAEEIDRAVACGAHIIGINNRDLGDFSVDVRRTMELRKRVPGGHVLVSESGIQTREHVKMLEGGGIDAILVGETLVASSNIQETIRTLLGAHES